MNKCNKCDFINEEKECWAQQQKTPRLCELAHEEDREDYRKLIHDNTLNPPYPTLINQATNLVSSAVKVATNAIRGNPTFVDESTESERLKVCEACPGNYFDAEQKRCKDCGCYMPAKITLAAMQCPQNYWVAITPPEEVV